MSSLASPHQHHKDITILFLKHAPQAGGACGLDELVKDIRALGSTFIKFSQYISCRGNCLPRRYQEALLRLDAGQQEGQQLIESPDIIEAIVEEELGKKISQVFSYFSPEPYAFASAGQIHRATLHTGRDVSVKVQRPAIRHAIVDDLKNLADIASFLDGQQFGSPKGKFGKLVEQFRLQTIRELDYRREAKNFAELGKHSIGSPNIEIPVVLEELTTSRVLTTDLLDGSTVSSAAQLGEAELERESLADDLVQSYLDQVLVAGVFHAEPNSENLWITQDRFISFCEVPSLMRTGHHFREPLVQLLTGIDKNQPEEIAEAVLRCSEFASSKEEDHDSLIQDMTQLIEAEHGLALSHVSVGMKMLKAFHACAPLGIAMSDEVTAVARGLSAIAKTASEICENFDLTQSIRRYLESFENEIDHMPIPFPNPLSRVV
ncbi:AarF/ABC1/UbiB kinase family protein [Luteolibacter pohnpeiensis]|uniref:AarF/ABC1/UbiB kinase family protein n=1 Tax=Luteolibacter pohnpeiensis TaxID=454153 RepID=A0A934SE93_9BACT|nr:AarF/ABC1/UbiB kinase family protein [Luteolibacter pohnpeiensis]MBK1883608.1 AarF/ABC1/UbiB kinase family protein [Luteolibacter pohnpeiensis]